MPFSDNDNQLINKMKTEAPEFYDLFMRTCNIYECQASSASHDILNHITYFTEPFRFLNTAPMISNMTLYG